MQFKQNRESPKNQIGARQAMRLWSRGWGWALTCLVAVAALAGLGRSLQAAGMQSRQPFIPSSAPMPDANKQREMQDEQTKKQNFEAANAERKKQIAEDSAKLLKLATELKTEVDKTTKDELSLSVIRKADEIEKLARNVKEKMKLTTGGN
jgi:uncharacterized protein involved in exopolysaccharide biosynthesis